MLIKLAVIDDHRLFIEGLHSILSEENGFQIVYQAYSDHIPESDLAFERIDVVLLDISLEGGNGIEVCRKIKKKNPKAKVLFFSAFHQNSVIIQALRSGGSGYILKNCSRSELFEAIRSVHNGKSYFSREISQTAVQTFLFKDPAQLSVASVTPREREILYWIVYELSNAEIAERLRISIKTVEIHRMRLLSKFGVKNTAGLVRKAIESNILADISL
ncbi:MAG: response regulator transcription factor [Spirosomataceae bacterium]